MITDKEDLQMLLYQLKSLNKDVIRNTSRNTNTNDIKAFVLGDSMIKHVQGWDITKRTESNSKVYMRQFSGSKVDYMKGYTKP